MLYKNISGVFWAKTSHTHSEDIRDLFILWKGHYTTPLNNDSANGITIAIQTVKADYQVLKADSLLYTYVIPKDVAATQLTT